MKVWLFLVVLKVLFASGQGTFDRGGSFSNVFDGRGVTTGCEATQDNCRCCLTMQKVNRKRDDQLSMLKILKDEYDQAVQDHKDLTQKQSGFSAALFAHNDNLQCVGPEDFEATLIYEVVFFDLNNNYDSSIGVFTAPYNGYYMITVTVFHDAGTPKDDTSCVLVYHNDVIIAASEDRSTHDHEDSATLISAQYLNASDQVYVKIKPGCVICAMDDHYNVISVSLIYAD